MAFVTVTMNGNGIRDWETFHDSFQEAFGYPDFYGRNMNAWIDCMSDLDEPGSGMTAVHAPIGGVVALQIDGAQDLMRRCPEQYAAIVECSAFVNWRRMERGQAPVIAISFWT